MANPYDIYSQEVGLNDWLQLPTLGLGVFDDLSSPLPSTYSGALTDPITDSVNLSNTISGSEVGSIFGYAKKTFTDTADGFLQGLDTNGTYKWVMGNATSYIDWNVTTADTLTVSGTIAVIAGSIAGLTISATALTATAGGNSTIISSGSTAFTAGPTGSPTFTVTQAGVLTATGVVISGAITATSGAIGGWVVTSDAIKDVAGVVGLSSAVTGGDDIRFWAGDATPASAEFRVYESGALVASSATITGAITATSGDIGGWIVTSGYIYNLQSGTPTASANDGLVLASGNEAMIVYEDTAKRLEVGYLSAGIYGLRIYATDGTTVIYEASDTQQVIAGWYFTSTTLATNVTAASANVLIDSANSLLRLGPTSGNYITLDGANLRMRSSNYSAGVAGFTVEPTIIEAENLVARGIMRGSTFMYDVISAVGGQVMVANSDVLASDMTALDAATMTIRGTVILSVNDIIVIRAVTASGIQEEYLRVTSAASAPTYSVTRDLAASFAANSNPAWQAGTTVVVQGSSDGAATYSGGWLRLLGAGTNSPYYSIYERTGVAYNAYTERLRMGNLNGFLDYAAATFGFAVGSSASTDANITIDPTNGIRLRNGTTSIVSLTNSGASIAGWNLVSGYIYNLQSGTPTSSPSDGVVLASGNEAMIIYEDTEKRLEIGYLSSGIYGIKGYATDGSTTLFELSDTQNFIAGWTISSTTLANSTNIILDASNKSISINDSTFGNDGFQVQYNGGDPRLYVGNGSDQFAKFDGTTFTSSGSITSQVSCTSGEALAAGDHLGFTSADTVKRYAPTALPAQAALTSKTSLATTVVYDNATQNGIFLQLSTSLYTFLHFDNDGGVRDPVLVRVPCTPSTATIGTLSKQGGITGNTTGGVKTVDMVGAGTNKVLCASSRTNNVRASVVDCTTTLTEGTQVSVDTTNCDQGYCEYISDSHVLIIYQDTSAASIVFSKYTLSGTTLSASSTGTITTPTGTFTLRGVRKFAGVDLFLLIIQNDTDGSAEGAVATYTQGSSTFTAISSWVHFPSDIDITSDQGASVSFAVLSATQMILTFATSSTNINSMLCTISGTTPSFSAVISTTRGASSGYSLVLVNARCALQTTFNGTTITYKLLEVDSSGTALTTRATQTDTTSASTAGTLESNSIGAAWQVSPTRMGVINYHGSNDDPEAGIGPYTLPPPAGIAASTVAAAASVTVIVSGPATSLVTLTATQKYYADIGGLLTTTSDGTPDKVGVTKDTTELIVKSW